MRITFWGKGGSGKSTLTSCFVRYIAQKIDPQTILAIDADAGANLKAALGMEGAVVPIGDSFIDIANTLESGNQFYSDLGFTPIPEMGTIPPSRFSRLLMMLPDEELFKKYGLKKGGITLLTVGGHEEKDSGDACYHVKLNALELIMHRLYDTEHDWVVTDLSAGVDTMGTSLVMAYDLNLFVLEPTEKSVAVFKKFKEFMDTVPNKPAYRIVLNKIRSDQDIEFIKQNVDNDLILATIRYSKDLRRFEQSDTEGMDRFIEANTGEFDKIIAFLRENIGKRWGEYHRALVSYYQSRSRGWWDAYTHKPLSDTYDREFVYGSHKNPTKKINRQ